MLEAKLRFTKGVPPECRPHWRAWSAHPEARLYEQPDFVDHALSQLPFNYEGGVIEVFDGCVLAGLLPFKFQRILAGLPTRRLTTLSLPVVAPGQDAVEVMRAVGAAAMATKGVSTVELLGRRSWQGEARSAFRPAGFEEVGKPGTIPLAPSWEEFLSRQPRKFRRLLRYDLKKAAREGWELEEWSGTPERALDTTRDLYDRWQNVRYPSYRGRFRSPPQDRRLPALFGADFRAFALCRGEEVASVLYGVAFRDTFYLLRQGNHPSHLAVSPSTTLRSLAIPRLVEAGIGTLEAVGGTEGCWKAKPMPRVHHVYHRSGLVSRLHRLAYRTLARHKRSRFTTAVRAKLMRIAPTWAGQGV
ncbi:MAG: GNAT family N-acetyltransferase [Thermoplasmatota archaeon]